MPFWYSDILWRVWKFRAYAFISLNIGSACRFTRLFQSHNSQLWQPRRASPSSSVRVELITPFWPLLCLCLWGCNCAIAKRNWIFITLRAQMLWQNRHEPECADQLQAITYIYICCICYVTHISNNSSDAILAPPNATQKPNAEIALRCGGHTANTPSESH